MQIACFLLETLPHVGHEDGNKNMTLRAAPVKRKTLGSDFWVNYTAWGAVSDEEY